MIGLPTDSLNGMDRVTSELLLIWDPKHFSNTAAAATKLNMEYFRINIIKIPSLCTTAVIVDDLPSYLNVREKKSGREGAIRLIPTAWSEFPLDLYRFNRRRVCVSLDHVKRSRLLLRLGVKANTMGCLCVLRIPTMTPLER